MLFSSITFLVFFLPMVLLFYYMLPSRAYKNSVLLFASLLFYAWGEPKYVLLMLGSIIFNYNAGLWIAAADKRRKALLICAISANIALLFVFKYLGFSMTIIDRLLNSLQLKPLHIIQLALPIGISFYTFQEISYLADVYKDSRNAQKSLLHLGLYIAFFPQLIAGPIVRYSDINKQIISRKETAAQFAYGLERFIIGLAKKILIANTVALVADKVYGASLFSYTTQIAWIAAFAYALQIYYDFSGYSDMAIGLAAMFGFTLSENFNYPYAAASITDFWRRWHISLTSFFRDYVYIPLGGNRKGSLRTILNRFIVFFTTGLWHGASINFILWGLAHGILMTAERSLKQFFTKNNVIIQLLHRIFTLLSVLLLWVLFRNGTKQSIKLFLKMFGINYTKYVGTFTPIHIDGMLLLNIDTKFYIIATIGIVFSFPWWRAIKQFFKTENNMISVIALALKYLALGMLLVLCYASLADNSYNPFIYFRF